MPDFVPLPALVDAIAGAVVDAQDQIQRAQVASLASFFDREGRPAVLTLRLPSLRPDARAGEEDLYVAPLLGLVPHSVLRIRQAEVSFEVQLGDLSALAEARADPGAPQAVRPAATRRTLSVAPGAASDPKRPSTTARVVLTVETLEPPEGFARMLQDVVKTQGLRPGETPRPAPPPAGPAPSPSTPSPAADPVADRGGRKSDPRRAP